MKVKHSTNLCACAEDLVAYLYGEASPAEAKDFERHLQLCASCRTELATFGEVREAVGEWRQQALGTLAAPAFEANAARTCAHAEAPARRRSALIALREFFTLSPAWMRAATAAVALLFCALAAISVAYFFQQPQTVVVEKQVESGYSQSELEAKIAAAIKEHDEAQGKVEPRSLHDNVAVAEIERDNASPLINRHPSLSSTAANNNRRQPTARRARVRPAVEPAATDYLPFTASIDDDELPALTDLVDDAN